MKIYILSSFIFYFTLLLLVSCRQDKNASSVINPQDFCKQIHLAERPGLSNETRHLDSMMRVKSGVYMLEEGDGAMITRAWLTENAEKTIDIQYFIFSVDNVGLIACDYLVRAADRGVKVRILVDDILVEADPEDILILDAHENIEIKIFNPGVKLGKNILQKAASVLTDFRNINKRMHNKVFIADEKVVITGGRNIADEYFDYDHEYNFRDRDVLLMGKISNEINHSFGEYWNHNLSVPVKNIITADAAILNNPAKYEKLHQYACNPENFWPQIRERITSLPQTFKEIEQSEGLIWLDSVFYVSDDPIKNNSVKGLSGGGRTTDALIELIKNAHKSIDIQTPYLVTTELSQQLFKEATARGVKIRILTNSLASTDNLEAFSGYQRDRSKLLQTGIRIFEFRPDAAVRFQMMTGSLQKELDYAPIFGLHAKSMVVDGKIAVTGTFNLDPRSANLNTECITIIHSKEVSEKLTDIMNIEFQPENSWETTPEFNPDQVTGMKKRAGVFIRKIVPKSIL